MSWIVFFCYEVGILVNSFSQHPLCPYDTPNDGFFYAFACATALIGFAITLMMLTAKIFLTRSGKERIFNIIAVNLVSIGLLSTLLGVSFHLGGVCVDSLG